MTDLSHQPLTDEDHRGLAEARAWVKGHISENPDENYEPVAVKLRLLDAVLTNNWVEPSETWKLQALGVCLGDAIAQVLLLEWVVVDDDYDRSLALNWPGTMIYAFPLTLISKRIEQGEAVDVKSLFEKTARTLQEMAFSGRYV